MRAPLLAGAAAGALLGVDTEAEQSLAMTGGTSALVNVCLVLVSEVPQRAQNRVRRGLTELAERRLLDLSPQRLQRLEIGRLAFAFGNVGEDLQHAFRADSAGHALAAGLALGELDEVPRDLDHAGFFVHHDEATRAHDRADLLERVVVQRPVQVLGRHAAARWAAGLRGLELAALRDAPANVEHDLPQRRTHGHLDEAGVVHLAGEREDLGAGALLGAEGPVMVGAVQDDVRNVGEGLDIVDVCGLAPQAGLRGERRTHARHAAPALDRCDEARLLAADERARAFLDLEMETVIRAHDVVAQQTRLFRVGHGLAQVLDRERVLGPHVDEPLLGADRAGRDDHPLDHRVGVALQDAAVHECAGVAFVRVADQVLRAALGRPAKSPLDSGREPGAAAASEPGGLHLLDDLLGRHLPQGLGLSLIPVLLEIVLEARGVDEPVVAEDEPLLLLVERHVVVVDDLLAGARVRVEQIVDDLTAQDRLIDNARHVVWGHALVEDVLGLDHHDWATFAETVTPRLFECHSVAEAPTFDLSRDRVPHALHAERDTARASANGDAGDGLVACVADGFLDVGKGRRGFDRLHRRRPPTSVGHRNRGRRRLFGASSWRSSLGPRPSAAPVHRPRDRRPC